MRPLAIATLSVLLGASTSARAGVFLHYTFDDTYDDASGQGNHGTLVLDPLGPVSFVDAPAAFGRAWSDPDQGSESRVDFTTPFVSDGSGAWTLAFWHDMSGGVSCPVFDPTTNDNSLLIRADSQNAVILTLGGVVQARWDTQGVIGQGTLSHLTLVADPAGIDGVDADGDLVDDTMALYVDGILRTPEAGTIMSAVPTALTMTSFGDGASGDDAFSNGHGVSDELWVFDGDALNADQVASLYTSNDPCLDDTDLDGLFDCVDTCPAEHHDDCDADNDGCFDDDDLNLVCDLDQVLTLTAGTAGPGGDLTLDVSWASPGGKVYVLASLAIPPPGGGPCNTAQDGTVVCTDLAPFRVLDRPTADGLGEASTTLRVPSGFAPGTTIYFQALHFRGSGAASEVVAFEVGFP